MPESGPNVVDELRARLAVTSGLDEGEYVVESQAPSRSAQAALSVAQPPAGSAAQIFITRAGLKLRAGPELTSELAGDGAIRAGARVRVVDSWTLPDGTERRCLASESHGEPLGWVSATTNGQPNLLTDAEAQAAHAASLAAAVTGIVTTRPQETVPSQKSKKKLPTFGGGGEKCLACGKTAYQAERAQVGSYFFHIDCMRCVECGPSRRLGSDHGVAANADGIMCLYCAAHEAEARRLYSQPIADEEPTKQPVATPAAAPPRPEASPRTSARDRPSARGLPAGLGTAADRALEEALKSAATASTMVAPSQSDSNPFARCLQCW